MDSFAGTSCSPAAGPGAGVDLAGKRVGVIGTGSTGVQLIPVVARQAAELHVFQRSAAFTLPWSVRTFEPGELDALKADYPAIREAQRQHPVGAARLSAFSLLLEMLAKPAIRLNQQEMYCWLGEHLEQQREGAEPGCADRMLRCASRIAG